MEDAVGNITIGPGPGGGVIRQRQNVDLVMAPGFEATAEWQVVSSVRLKGSYLFTHPTIERGRRSCARRKTARANSGKRFHRRHRVDAHGEMGGERATSLLRPAVRGRSELARARALHDLRCRRDLPIFGTRLGRDSSRKSLRHANRNRQIGRRTCFDRRAAARDSSGSLAALIALDRVAVASSRNAMISRHGAISRCHPEPRRRRGTPQWHLLSP